MSETTNLKLKKHDNPETNTEKFDIENYLNGNWDKIDKNVGEVNTNISNINSKNKEQDTNIEQLQENTETSSNKIAELEKELKEAQEDFYQSSIRGQVSGEYIHVEDSSNCRAKIGIGGNHEQETREGYNLLNFDVKQDSRVTYNKEDGTVTINGQGGFYLNLDRINLTANKTYKQKLEFISGSAKTISGTDMKNQAVMSLKIETWLKNDNYIAYTPEADITKSGLWLNANVNFDNAKIRIWAYEGTEDKGYEQYGAMPSLDYPSQVVAVGSNVNLFAGGDTVTNNGVTFTKNKDDSYDIVGMATEQANCINFVDIQNSGIINGNIYNIHVSENLPDGVKILIEAYNDTAWIRHVLGSSLIPNVSKANIENVNKIRFTLRVEKGISVNIHNLRIKLEKDTIETAYSKYGQGCVKITKCNKNLFDKDNAIKEYELNGSTGKITSNRLYFTSDYIRVNPNEQYYLSGKNTGNSNCFYNKDKKFISKINLENGLLTVPDDLNIYYLRINSRLTAIDTTMLEKNTKKSAYEEHQEQTYIMPIQKEMLVNDYLDYDNEEEVHVWNKQILTGNEKVMCSLAPSEEASKKYKTVYLAVTLDTAGEEKLYKTGNVMSNMFKNLYNPNQIWGNDAEYAVEESIALQTKLRLRINKSRLIGYSDDLSLDAKAELFKAYLKAQYDAGTPVMIYYKQATPTRLKFTDEQKAVAKELNNARTYKNVTNITTDSKAILSLDYAKDLETQNQKMQNEIDEIKQLLSTTQTSALLLDNMQNDIESEVE